MIPLPGHQGCLILCGVAAIAAGVLGWQINGWRLHSQIEREKDTYSAMLAASNKATADAEAKYRQTEKNAADQIANVAESFHKELTDAQSENDRLRAAVAAGTQRLYVRASCPTTIGSVPANAGATGRADATPAELDADARPDYFSLIAAAEQAEQQIIALQKYASACHLLTTQAH